MDTRAVQFLSLSLSFSLSPLSRARRVSDFAYVAYRQQNGYEGCFLAEYFLKKLEVLRRQARRLPNLEKDELKENVEEKYSVAELLYINNDKEADYSTVFSSHAQMEALETTLNALFLFELNLDFQASPDRSNGATPSVSPAGETPVGWSSKMCVQEKPVYFVDVDCIRQSASGDFKPPKVKDVIRGIGMLALTLVPWRSPEVLTRIWCAWGNYSALATNTKFHATIVDHEDFEDECVNNPDVSAVFEAVKGMKAENASARVIEDKEMVFEAILNEDGGFLRLNLMVAAAVIDSMEKAIKAMGKEQLADLRESESKKGVIRTVLKKSVRTVDDTEARIDLRTEDHPANPEIALTSPVRRVGQHASRRASPNGAQRRRGEH